MHFESPSPNHKFLGKGFRVAWLCSTVTTVEGSCNVTEFSEAHTPWLDNGGRMKFLQKKIINFKKAVFVGRPAIPKGIYYNGGSRELP